MNHECLQICFTGIVRELAYQKMEFPENLKMASSVFFSFSGILSPFFLGLLIPVLILKRINSIIIIVLLFI